MIDQQEVPGMCLKTDLDLCKKIVSFDLNQEFHKIKSTICSECCIPEEDSLSAVIESIEGIFGSVVTHHFLTTFIFEEDNRTEEYQKLESLYMDLSFMQEKAKFITYRLKIIDSK